MRECLRVPVDRGRHLGLVVELRRSSSASLRWTRSSRSSRARRPSSPRACWPPRATSNRVHPPRCGRGSGLRRQRLVLDRAHARRADRRQALRRQPPPAPRPGAPDARGARRLPDRDRPLHPGRRARPPPSPPAASTGPGGASSCFDIAAGAIWGSYAGLLGYFGGKTFKDSPFKGFLVAFGDRARDHLRSRGRPLVPQARGRAVLTTSTPRLCIELRM